MKRVLRVLLYIVAVALVTMFFASNPANKYPVIDNASLFTNQEEDENCVCAVVGRGTVAFFSTSTYHRLDSLINDNGTNFLANCQFCETSSGKINTKKTLFRKVKQDVYIDRYKLTEKELSRLKLTSDWRQLYRSAKWQELGMSLSASVVALDKSRFLAITTPVQHGHGHAVIIDVAQDQIIKEFDLKGCWQTPDTVKMNDGRILLYGGFRNNDGIFEVIDPEKEFSYLLECHLTPQRECNALFANFNGQVLVVGGVPSPTAFREAVQITEVDVGQQRLRKLPSMKVERVFDRAEQLPPNAVLVTPSTMVVTGGWKETTDWRGDTRRGPSHTSEVYDHLLD